MAGHVAAQCCCKLTRDVADRLQRQQNATKNPSESYPSAAKSSTRGDKSSYGNDIRGVTQLANHAAGEHRAIPGSYDVDRGAPGTFYKREVRAAIEIVQPVQAEPPESDPITPRHPRFQGLPVRWQAWLA